MDTRPNLVPVEIDTPISLVDYGIGEIAKRIAGVAMFIDSEYCRSQYNKNTSIYAFMKSLYDHLVNYGWPIVREGTLEKTLFNGENLDIDGREGARAMQALVPFFEARAQHVQQIGDSGDLEISLAADLGFAAKYTLIRIGASLDEIASICDDLSPESPKIQEDEQPSPQEIDSVLRGRHLDSRTWFEDDVNFAELIGEPRQWLDPEPEYWSLVPSSSPEAPPHFCDATPLGISAVTIIAMQHPISKVAVREMDIDILRFVRLALWDWTNGHAERVLERRSLEVVRGEIKKRREERVVIAGKELADSVLDTPATPIVDGIEDSQAETFDLLPPSSVGPDGDGDVEAVSCCSSGNPLSDQTDLSPLEPNTGTPLETQEIAPSSQKPEVFILELDGPDVSQAQLDELQIQVAHLAAQVGDLSKSRNVPKIDGDKLHISDIDMFRGRGSPVQRTATIDEQSSVNELNRSEAPSVAQTATFMLQHAVSGRYVPPPSSQLPAIEESGEEQYRGRWLAPLHTAPEVLKSSNEAEGEEDNYWLDPLTTDSRQTLRSSRGRRRIEDAGSRRPTELEIDWRKLTARVPNRIVMVKKVEQSFESLKCTGEKEVLDLDTLPRMRESELVVREV